MTSVEPVIDQPDEAPMQVAPTRIAPPPGTGAWHSGLCGCCGDIGSCCLGAFCAPILGCIISGKMGECCCAACVGPASLRTRHRIQHGIAGSVCKDSLAAMFCLPCVLCQLAREIKANTSQPSA